MKTEVRVSKYFEKVAKPLFKKYPSFVTDISDLQNLLIAYPFSGSPLGNNCYKVRLKIKSKGKGKSGGGRVITHVVAEILRNDVTTIVTLLTCYDKSDVATISEKELKDLISKI